MSKEKNQEKVKVENQRTIAPTEKILLDMAKMNQNELNYLAGVASTLLITGIMNPKRA